MSTISLSYIISYLRTGHDEAELLTDTLVRIPWLQGSLLSETYDISAEVREETCDALANLHKTVEDGMELR